jgi:hypothetical protein
MASGQVRACNSTRPRSGPGSGPGPGPGQVRSHNSIIRQIGSASTKIGQVRSGQRQASSGQVRPGLYQAEIARARAQVRASGSGPGPGQVTTSAQARVRAHTRHVLIQPSLSTLSAYFFQLCVALILSSTHMVFFLQLTVKQPPY